MSGEEQPRSFVNLAPGDTAPWFKARTPNNPSFTFDVSAGRYIVFGFIGTAGDATGQAAVRALADNRDLFDDAHASLFWVSQDAADEQQSRLTQVRGTYVFWDFDSAVSRLYGAAPRDFEPGQALTARRFWMVLDPTLRVMRIVPFSPDGGEAAELFAYVRALPPPSHFAGVEIQAPILYLPNVFEPELCEKLIGLYEAHGGEESGFMREVDGKTVAIQDHSHKRRRDYLITEEDVIATTKARVVRRITPQVLKAYNFKVTRMERYIVGCYTAEDGGHFRAHRDNTTRGTAHRRFAVTINLNGDFEGGELSFPEYGPRSFKPPPGGAVVFPCALLHKVSPVTAGRRYAFLPFLYDEEAARLRQANNAFLGDGVGAYTRAELREG